MAFELGKRTQAVFIIKLVRNEKSLSSFAGEADFFITNYSTGSMYPARFHHLPGVAHLSNVLLKAVRDMHAHHDTFVVPLEFVEDLPDPGSARTGQSHRHVMNPSTSARNSSDAEAINLLFFIPTLLVVLRRNRFITIWRTIARLLAAKPLRVRDWSSAS